MYFYSDFVLLEMTQRAATKRRYRTVWQEEKAKTKKDPEWKKEQEMLNVQCIPLK